MEIKYEGKHAIFNGQKFYVADGRFISTKVFGKARKYLHRTVWEYHNGDIPDGMHIHHKDHNKLNDAIQNLQLVTPEEHARIHKEALTEDDIIALRKRMDHARIFASKWHGTPEGRLWHSQHGISAYKNRQHIKFKCIQCEASFESKDRGKPKFCSNPFKSKWRRDAGLDNVKKICTQCGGSFERNKYAKTETCSRSCADRLRHSRKCQATALA